MGLLTSVKLSDVPENVAEKLTATATIGEVIQKEQGEYVSISIPLHYNTVEGDERTFTARFRVKPEWCEAGYQPEEDEKFSYQLNMQRLYRGLFKAVGAEEMDLDAIEGLQVGFTAGPQAGKNGDKSRQEIKSFFPPKS